MKSDNFSGRPVMKDLSSAEQFAPMKPAVAQVQATDAGYIFVPGLTEGQKQTFQELMEFVKPNIRLELRGRYNNFSKESEEIIKGIIADPEKRAVLSKFIDQSFEDISHCLRMNRSEMTVILTSEHRDSIYKNHPNNGWHEDRGDGRSEYMGINIGIELIGGDPTLFTKNRKQYEYAETFFRQCIIAPENIEKANYGDFAIWRRNHEEVKGALHASPPDPIDPKQKRLMCIFQVRSEFLRDLFVPNSKIDKQKIFQELFDAVEANMQKANEIRPAEAVETVIQGKNNNRLISKGMESLFKAIEGFDLNSISSLLKDKNLLEEAQRHNVCVYAQNLIKKYSEKRPVSEEKIQKAQDTLVRIIECGVVPETEIRPAEAVETVIQGKNNNRLISKGMESLFKELIKKHSEESPVSEEKVQKAQDTLIRIIECGVMPEITKDLSVTKEEVIRLMNLEPRYKSLQVNKGKFF